MMEIPVVHVTALHEQLGFQERLDYPMESLCRPLTTWLMERDDAPILRYLYRNFRPKRHLEFGTWEGLGTVMCLEESDATVWTINLKDGERYPDGSRCYPKSRRDPASFPPHLLSFLQADGSVSCGTDSIGFIGQSYLEKDLGHRVCQIYADSRAWTTGGYPEGFFDSVLIDGGHLPDVVDNDTQKALSLLRTGGMVLWHDFCPPVGEAFPSTQGVMQAVLSRWKILTSEMKALFWIYPSWILLGVKR